MEELQNIQNLIYVIRGQRVMLDFDLARIYQVETKYLKRQVRRNMERFEGDDFMFEVTPDEILRCQNVTSSWGGSRYNAFAFTEIGVSMLSSVLSSKVAICDLKATKAHRLHPTRRNDEEDKEGKK
jgi:hypothetical protein